MTQELLPVSAPGVEPRGAGTPISLDGHDRDRLIRRAKSLSWLSLAWMTVEGAVAISAALAAGSVALLGFGIDSAIEGVASVIVIWRFTGARRLSAEAEERAQKLVAISFFLLAPYIAQDAIRTLIDGKHPGTSWVGIGLSIGSIVVMPALGHAKQRIGQRLGSAATAGEGASEQRRDQRRPEAPLDTEPRSTRSCQLVLPAGGVTLAACEAVLLAAAERIAQEHLTSRLGRATGGPDQREIPA